MHNNKTEILQRDAIQLNPSQTKMLISGWGEETYENAVVEKITYLSDGLKVKGYIAYPKNTQSEKLPCIIWNRGGYQNKGAIDHFTARGIFGNLASWGYVVFASQYRGNDGGEGKEEIGGNDVNDILNLIPLADEFSFADKNSWGIEGWSRGGMMTYLTLLKNPNFKCAVLTGAISNIKAYAEKS
ncbi:MAG: prolyl oligopeptidase family serine peptidase, partial [Ignavibacteriaceae bacterium]